VLRGRDSLAERGRIVLTPPIFGTADARDLKFCMRVEKLGALTKIFKGRGRDTGFNSRFLDFLLSPERRKLET